MTTRLDLNLINSYFSKATVFIQNSFALSFVELCKLYQSTIISKERKTCNIENKECLQSGNIVVKMVPHHNNGSYLIG